MTNEIVIEFNNDQHFKLLGMPAITMMKGLYSECFHALKRQETGIFSAHTEENANEIFGVLTQKVFTNIEQPQFLHIYFKINPINTLVSLALNQLSGSSHLEQDQYQNSSSIIISEGWQDIKLDNLLFISVFMNSRFNKTDLKMRLYTTFPLADDGVYKIQEMRNTALYLGNWYVGNGQPGTNRLIRAYLWTDGGAGDPWMTWRITRIFNNVFTIRPRDWASNPLNYAIACDGSLLNAWTFNGPYNPFDYRFLWEISQDDWGYYFIKSYLGNLYWSNDNSGDFGQIIQLRSYWPFDYSQKFFIQPL